MLTPRQQLFVNEYLANPNATEAAKRAGYSEKTAHSQGQRLLKKVEVKQALEKRVGEAIITADEVLNGVKAIALNGQREADQLKAYELLGKHLAMWTDRTEIRGDLNIATRVIEPK